MSESVRPVGLGWCSEADVRVAMVEAVLLGTLVLEYVGEASAGLPAWTRADVVLLVRRNGRCSVAKNRRRGSAGPEYESAVQAFAWTVPAPACSCPQGTPASVGSGGLQSE